MNRSPYIDPLEERLSNPPRLEGSAFTAEVLRRLPARRAGLRGRILAGGAALSTCIAAALLAPPASGLGPALLAAVRGSLPEGSGAVALLTLAAFGVTAAVAAAAELGGEVQPDAA